MYYRLHASILKVMVNCPGKVAGLQEVFEKYIKEAEEGPFANCQEKTAEKEER